MNLIASLIIFINQAALLVKRLFRHLLVCFVSSPFRWKTEHRKIKYEFSYRRYS